MSLRDPSDDVEGLFFPLSFPTTGPGIAAPITGGVVLGAWNFIETTGTTPATVEIRGGGDANGQLVVAYNLNPGQSVYDLAPGKGISLRSGCVVNIVSGSVRGGISVVKQ